MKLKTKKSRKRFIYPILTFISILTLSYATFAAPANDTMHLSNTSPDEVLRLFGETPDDKAGLAMTSGDFNGDGINDLLFGASEADENGHSGSVYILWGSENLHGQDAIDLSLEHPQILQISGENTGDNFGTWTSAADLNNDGFDELIISAYKAGLKDRNDAGKVYILFGSSELSLAEDFIIKDYSASMTVILGAAAGDHLGFLLDKGDINGDGFEDVLMKAYLAEPKGRKSAGESYVLFGSESAHELREIDLNASHDSILRIPGIGDIWGYDDHASWAVGTGDINGDGCDEILIGSRNSSPLGIDNAGETFVIFGSEDISGRAEYDLFTEYFNTLKIQGFQRGEGSGNIVTSGDINNDSYDDIIIGALGAGKVYIVYGNAQIEQETSIELDVTQSNVSSLTGTSSNLGLLPVTGDMNGDGIDDLLIGEGSAYNRSGAAYIVFGSPEFHDHQNISLNSGQDIIRIYGENSDDMLGFRTIIGDFNGDGKLDAVMSNHGADPYGRDYAGGVVIAWGKADWGLAGYSFAPKYFTYTKGLDYRAYIIVPYDITLSSLDEQLHSGDEIGVFTHNGICAGAAVWNGVNDIMITVWGDRPDDNTIDGFLNGEPYNIRFWNSRKNREHLATVSYRDGNGVFQSRAVSQISSLSIDIALVVEKKNALEPFSLRQNSPNPFNPVTAIPFSLTRETEISLEIYNVTGKKVCTLADGRYMAGEYEAIWNASMFSSGVYYCRLKAEKYTRTGKMLLLK